MSEIVPCLACGTDFEREYQTRHFCDVHQVAEERRKHAIYQAEQDDLMRHAKQYALDEFQRIAARTPYDMSLMEADEFLDSIGYEDGDDIPLVKDVKPEGWLSPRGPEQGYSTYDDNGEGSVAVILYGYDGRGGLMAKALADPWWDANPHWTYELDEGWPAVSRMVEWAYEPRACEDSMGTHAGYMRHVRAGESACRSCLCAKAEYVRAQYEKSVTR